MVEIKKTHDLKYWVIIPAAGIGNRMGLKTPKQYLKLNQKNIIEQTVSLFTNHPIVQCVIVMLHAEDSQWSTINIDHPEKIVTAIGGETRAKSVMKGLEYLQAKAETYDWVLTHDAVRPCLSTRLLDHFIRTVADHRVGGLLGMPINSTIKKVDADHGVRETIPREGLWVAQTPQMFRYGFLFDAMQAALETKEEITDEAQAIELVGEHPLMIEGDWRNIKITHADDLERVRSILGKN